MEQRGRTAAAPGRIFALFAAVLAGAVLINALICFSGSDDYAVTKNGAVSVSLINSANALLSQIDDADIPAAISELDSSIEDLTEYSEAKKRLIRGSESVPYLGKYTRAEAEAISERYDLSESETAGRIELLAYCRDRLAYAESYRDFLAYINGNAENMSKARIFDGTISKRAAKVQADFYGLENIKISPVPEEGVLMAAESSSGALLALSAAVISGVMYALWSRRAFRDIRRVKTYPAAFGAALFAGACLIFGIGLLRGETLAGLGQLSRSVQSVSGFRSCPYPISVGTFLALGVLSGAGAALAVYYFTVGAVSCGGRKGVIIAVAAAALQWAAAASGLPVSVYQAMKPYEIMGVYDQVIIFGEAADPAAVMAAGLLFTLVICRIFSARMLSSLEKASERQAQEDYFGRINDRCTEARQIRHDIGNHLTAIAALLDSGDVSRAREYLGDVTNGLLGSPLPSSTGSRVLDMLLFHKREEMRSRGVTLQADILTEVSCFGISDYDLCVIFGNILDNAAEAALGLPSEDRVITLTVRKQMDMLLIFCKNKYTGEMPSSNGFATIKRDRSRHGQGLTGIRRTAGKYGGDISISDEGGVFEISVIINGKK